MDLTTKRILGWKIVPGTHFEVLIAQNPRYESVEDMIQELIKNEKILITVAIPYANDPIHFVHLVGAYLPAECYARAMRLLDNDVLFVCGSDEYGVAIELQAKISKRTLK